ncbi:MAG: hypothetical protein RIT14_1758 [Pseudomonadota bacterium]|jgi:hypothetical protein
MGVQSVSILGGDVIAAAPAGYCVARDAGRQGADNAVVLMGRCSASGAADPAVVMVSVGEAGSGSLMAAGSGRLRAYFTSEAGRAVLSRDGQAADVAVLESAMEGGAFLMRLRDGAVGEYWRAVTDLRGRLVTLSVNGAEGAARDLPPDEGRALLMAALAALRAANSQG